MYIVKRNLKEEKISFAKILNRIQKQNSQGNLNLELTEVLKIIYSKLFDKITSEEVENEIIDTLAYKSVDDPLYSVLAARIFVTRLHKNITSKFSLNFKRLFDNDLVDRKFFRFVKKNAKLLDEAIDPQKDFQYTSIFSLYTFRKSYMLKPFNSNKVMETPQFVLMRVAVQLGFLEGIDFVLQVYKTLSTLKYTQASPTLFNSCTKLPALASCFLLSVEDSVEDIYETLKTCALISKSGGGIGVDFSKVRSKNTLIKSTNGTSSGIVKAIQNYNMTALYINQSSKRRGSFAIYLTCEHPDLLDFLELRTNTGGDEMKARDLFYGLWVSNTFMEYIKDPREEYWYFFDPDTEAAKALDALYGSDHLKKYKQFVEEEKYTDKIETDKLWMAILNAQIETGMPYFCMRDHANLKSNLRHSAEIRSSNLCVSGTTLMLTRDGYFPMAELEDCTVDAWTGFEFSEVTVRRTAEKATMKKIFFNNGMFLECTPEHNFFVQRGNEIAKIPAKELRKGFMLDKYNMPIITNERGEVDFSEEEVSLLNPPFQGSRKQIETYLLKHYKNSKEKKNHVQQLVAFLLCQQLTGQKDVQTFVYKIGEENIEGPTFCATEPIRGRLTFNGINTGNCSEILLPASDAKKEIGTCNLGSISLKHHVNLETQTFDFEGLQETTKQLTRNLNQVIDCMYYSHSFSENSNKRHRPIGIGVQGFADTLYLLKMPFESEEAAILNRKIFENIYYAAYEESADLAIEYPEKIPKSFQGSPLSQGKLQFDLWAEQGHFDLNDLFLEWTSLKEKIKNTGVINMLITAVMPTASTSQILENYEAVEPPMSIIFNRSTLSGNFPVINKYLINDLKKLNLWNETVRQSIVETGSIQHLKNFIPFEIRNLYKTVWEIDQRVLVNLSAQRGPFVDHSQSLNLSFSGLTTKQDITECLFLGYKKGLKTCVYYTRTKPAISQKYTAATCSLENKEACEMCSG